MSMTNQPGKQGTGRTTKSEDLVGRMLRGGEYQIKRVLGHGGMGKVFLASHITLDTPLALKQCRADQPLPESVAIELEQLLHTTVSTTNTHNTQQAEDSSNPQQPLVKSAVIDFPSSGGMHTDRFLREALLLARLNHPAIPALYDYFFEDGYWYLVMDYIPGPTLSMYMRKQGALPPLEALNYAIQLCDVLEYLHQQTPPVIFRDLKPSNVILTPDCRLVLVDFGIARYFKEGQSSDTHDLGSPGYAPPEQYQGEGQTDARSDLYSLGIILHEMLSGQRPTHLKQQPESLYSLNPNLSPVLSSLVSVATRLEPEYRFQSAYTLYSALERTYALEERHAAYKQATLHPIPGQPQQGQPQAGRPPGSPLPYTPLPPDESAHPTAPEGPRPVYSRANPCGWPGGGHPGDERNSEFLAQREQTREILAVAHRKQQEREQLEQELTVVDESLHLREYLSTSSATLPLAKDQEKQAHISQPHAFTSQAFRVVQFCFVCALILFLTMASLLAYTRVIRHGNTITRGQRQQAHATPIATPTPAGTWQPLPSPPSAQADNTVTYVQIQGSAYIYMNGGYRGPNNTPHYDRSLYRYNIAGAHWETLATNNFPGMVNNAAALDEQGNLFFTAGYSSDIYAVSSLLYEYQPGRAVVQKIVPPPQMPIGFGAAMITDQHGHLYITQGFMQAGNPHTSAGTGWYRYNISTGQWQQLAPLPLGLGYVVLAPDNAGGIVLLGGSVDAGQHQPTMRIYRYNIALNAWMVAPTNAPLAFSGAASCLDGPGRLVVIGGYDASQNKSLNNAWLVDLRTLHWTPLATIPNGGSLLGTAACDGHGHVFLLRGANNPSQPTADFWELTIRN
jgi:serine/threonine protein kinase/N-acetylneuraminic acid mutarotase